MIDKDVIIIGAGPVGLFAVHQCGMMGLSMAVVDALPEIGGQCTALYPEKPIYDIPSWPQISGGDLIAQLEEQVKPFDPVYCLDQQVIGLSQDTGNALWRIETSKGNALQGRAVIIAAGAGAFGPNRPPLEGIENFENRSVFYMVRKKEDLRGKRVVIAGGGDSAVDWAIALVDIASSVTVVHRRATFRAAPSSVKQLHDLVEVGKIEFAVPAQLSGLSGEDGALSAVHVKDMEGAERSMEADILLPFFGLAASLGPMKEWGLGLEHQAIITDPSTSMTNLDSVYAIGDIAIYPNKLKLILTGFSEAAMAAHDIWRCLNPGQVMHQEYSTTKGLPTSSDKNN